MQSPKEEIIDSFDCSEHVVLDKESYKISLLKLLSPREFVICCTETKRNCSKQDVEEIFACLLEFIKNNPETSPCYSIMDVSKTDAYTLQQLKIAADAFNSIQHLLKTRLVGSIVKVNEENSSDNILSSTFKRLYTPIRPIQYYEHDGEASSFIKEWEQKLM